MTTEPILKVLTGARIGSRRRMADAIKQGIVEVNDIVVSDFRHPVNKEKDRISLDGRPVELTPKQLVYLMLHKPQGIISTASEERGRRTVNDIIPGKYRRLKLYPVGRLDKDSTGLLLLTNDGDLTYRVTHPKFEHEKEYLVQIEGRLKLQEKRMLQNGLKLEDGMTAPTQVREAAPPPYNYSITIHEGKKRQVRRMFAKLGYRIIALKRVRMGNLTLDDLKEGEVHELRAREVQNLIGRKR